MRRAGRQRRLRNLVLVFLALVAPAGGRVQAQSLRIGLEGDALRIQAPRLRFIEGRPLDRLRDGGSVVFAFELRISARPDGPALIRAEEQFNLSYDLWEEWFAVTRIGPPSRSASRLSLTEAETWCLDNLTIRTEGLDADEMLWVSVRYRAEVPDPDRDNASGSFFSLEGLIDLLSRRDAGAVEGSLEAGPFRLSEFR